jgi:hypothetical protein
MQKIVKTIDDIREACEVLTKAHRRDISFRLFNNGYGSFRDVKTDCFTALVFDLNREDIIIEIPDTRTVLIKKKEKAESKA